MKKSVTMPAEAAAETALCGELAGRQAGDWLGDAAGPRASLLAAIGVSATLPSPDTEGDAGPVAEEEGDEDDEFAVESVAVLAVRPCAWSSPNTFMVTAPSG